jgi:hypothetical protein
VSNLVRSIALAWLALCGASANAGWSVSGDVEQFKWQEATSPTVTEKGPRWGFGWEYEQLRPAGWQFAYRGQFRNGTVDYTGSFLFGGGAATARTQYTGLVNEAQGIYRLADSPFGLELVSGLGWDYWERNILPDQKENYSVVFLRLGVNLDARASRGWFGGGGVKLPLYVAENAHLDELGFNQNPRLEPKGETSFYAQLGYRFTRQWSAIGYYDSYRFGESKPVATTTPAFPGTTVLVFQPASNIDTYGLRIRYSFP